MAPLTAYRRQNPRNLIGGIGFVALGVFVIVGSMGMPLGVLLFWIAMLAGPACVAMGCWLTWLGRGGGIAYVIDDSSVSVSGILGTRRVAMGDILAVLPPRTDEFQGVQTDPFVELLLVRGRPVGLADCPEGMTLSDVYLTIRKMVEG